MKASIPNSRLACFVGFSLLSLSFLAGCSERLPEEAVGRFKALSLAEAIERCEKWKANVSPLAGFQDPSARSDQFKAANLRCHVNESPTAEICDVRVRWDVHNSSSGEIQVKDSRPESFITYPCNNYS